MNEQWPQATRDTYACRVSGRRGECTPCLHSKACTQTSPKYEGLGTVCQQTMHSFASVSLLIISKISSKSRKKVAVVVYQALEEVLLYKGEIIGEHVTGRLAAVRSPRRHES